MCVCVRACGCECFKFVGVGMDDGSNYILGATKKIKEKTSQVVGGHFREEGMSVFVPVCVCVRGVLVLLVIVMLYYQK